MNRRDVGNAFLAGLDSGSALGLSLLTAFLAGVLITFGATLAGFSDSDRVWAAAVAALVFFIVGAIAQGLMAPRDPQDGAWRKFWLDAETRFALIDGEADACASIYEDGVVEWNVHVSTEHGGSMRALERFIAEATRLGPVVRQQRLQRKLEVTGDEADDDLWLNSVAALVNEESRYQGSGHNQRGSYSSFWMSRVVHASRTACAILAARDNQ